MRKLDKSELKRVYGAGGPGTHRHVTHHSVPHNHGNLKANGFTMTLAHSDGVHAGGS